MPAHDKTGKRGLKGKRLKAALDTNYLLKVATQGLPLTPARDQPPTATKPNPYGAIIALPMPRF